MNYVVKKISEIDNNQLHIFYKDVFKDRCEVLLKNLKWYYRINYLNCEPIVLVLKNKVIGQLGLIPIKVKIRNNIIPATWYIDLVVHPEFQGKGLGSILVKEGQKQSKMQIALCNEAALKVYKKFNWQINISTKRLARPINPIKWVPFINNLNSKIFKNLYNFNLKKKLANIQNIHPFNFDENINKIFNSFSKRKIITSNSPEIIRDEEWLRWRLLEFPNRTNLKFFELNDNYVIVHFIKSRNIRRLNIIMYYYLGVSEETKMYYSITKWALENNFDLIWSCSTNQNLVDNLSEIFPKKFIKPITIASASLDKNIHQHVKENFSNIEAIDSDTDSIFLEKD